MFEAELGLAQILLILLTVVQMAMGPQQLCAWSPNPKPVEDTGFLPSCSRGGEIQAWF